MKKGEEMIEWDTKIMKLITNLWAWHDQPIDQTGPI